MDNANLRIGAHLVTPRFGYEHHGIYAGNGMVIHYGGLKRFIFQRGPVAEIPLASFTRGRQIQVLPSAQQAFPSEEIVRRARSRVGENAYDLISNNCEHFCEWAIFGSAKSPQIDLWIQRAKRIKEFLSPQAIGLYNNPSSAQ